ncbi:MAG: hypothetical protein ACQEXJ_12140 [Myxococcota bacterium]
MSRPTLLGSLLALLMVAAVALGACGEEEGPGEPGCCQISEAKCAPSPPMTPKNCKSAEGQFFAGQVCNTETQQCE